MTLAEGKRLSREGVWLVLGTLALLVAVNVPQLGSDPWLFRPGEVSPRGILGPLVRMAGERWDYGFVRTPGVIAGLGLALLAALAPRLPPWRAAAGYGAALAVVAALALPATLLQVGLRDATAPWFFTNDSTYQIELAGDLVLDGDNPYGHEYAGSGLERFYSRDGSVGPGTVERQVALRHFAYFPGTPVSAALWRVLPGPLDDYRILVLLATLGLLFAPLLFPGPLAVRIAAGALLAGNPLSVRAAWFGAADAPSLLALVLAFGLVLRSRFAAAGLALGAAIMLKQFAVVALPFLVLIALRGGGPAALRRGGAALGATVAAVTLPFLVAGPGALWADTIRYGAATYRIVGYGLSNLLLEAGVLDDRFGPYPFAWLALLVWLPVTAWLLWRQARSPALWTGALGFTVSIFLLIFLGRAFQTSYLVWPLTGLALSALVAAGERASERP
ncbi:MAG: hypothetical protein ABR521_05435 [Gaiellaceae bacterium]